MNATMKNSDTHTFSQAMAWLNQNGYVPINWNMEGPCNPGDFAGRHESIRMADGTWLWAAKPEAE